MRPTKYEKRMLKTIQTRIDASLLSKIDCICTSTGRNRSDLIREILEYGTENFKKIQKG